MPNEQPQNLHYLSEEVRRLRESGLPPSFDGGGGGGYDPRMEERVKRLEAAAEKTVERLTTIERDLAVVKSNYATKEDLHKELHATTWKVIAAIAALCGAVFWMARNIEPPRLTSSYSAPAIAPAPAATAPPPAK
jgi:hypothetical protein